MAENLTEKIYPYLDRMIEEVPELKEFKLTFVARNPSDHVQSVITGNDDLKVVSSMISWLARGKKEELGGDS